MLCITTFSITKYAQELNCNYSIFLLLFRCDYILCCNSLAERTEMYEFHYNCKSVRSLDMNSFKETLGYYPFSIRNAIGLWLYLKTL